MWQLVPLLNKLGPNLKKNVKLTRNVVFGDVCKTIYFCKKATHQGIHKNFDVLHQHFWQEDTKLWQLVPLMNKLGQNFEKIMKLTQNVVFWP